jgi:hypothetical protein
MNVHHQGQDKGSQNQCAGSSTEVEQTFTTQPWEHQRTNNDKKNLSPCGLQDKVLKCFVFSFSTFSLSTTCHYTCELVLGLLEHGQQI